VRYEVLAYMAMKTAVFWEAVTCSLTHSCQRFGGKYCLLLLKMEATGFSETSIPTRRTAQRHVQGDYNIKESLVNIFKSIFEINIFLFSNTSRSALGRTEPLMPGVPWIFFVGEETEK
jgi:hypothetical protein